MVSGDTGERVTSYLRLALALLLVYAGLMAWFGFSSLAGRSMAALSRPQVELAALLVTLFAGTSSWLLRHKISAGLNRVMDGAAEIESKRWLSCWLAIGLALRLAWALGFDGRPNSDGGTYVLLAKAMLAGDDYAAGGTRAYWPPGYPLFLIPWLVLFDIDRWAILASNLFLFVVSVLGVRALARLGADAGTERLAILLICLWPNLIFQSGMPEKEQVLVALMPWILASAVLAALRPRRSTAAFPAVISGLLMGAANLVQPALMLFPAVLFCFWALATRRIGRTILLGLAFVVGVTATVAPWTLRNFQVFNRWVLISTNGGIILYGANNPRANGGYFEYWGESDLLRMDELTVDREGRRRALDWMTSNPGSVAALAFEKNLLFMGDDAVGAYQTLKRGGATDSAVAYAVVKLYANLSWLAFWSMLLSSLFAGWRGSALTGRLGLIAAGGFIYGFALHSLAESAGKHHVYAIGLLCVLLPCVARGSRPVHRLKTTKMTVPPISAAITSA